MMLRMAIAAMISIWAFIGLAIIGWTIAEYLKRGKKLEFALNTGLLYFVLTLIIIGIAQT